MTTVFETLGIIRSDGTLELDEKPAGPPGRVRVRVESIEVPDTELAKRFAELNAAWKEGTRFTSKMKTMAEHPAFREIVALGEKVVPLILADLERNGGFGFLALKEITGVDPLIPEGHEGNKAICEGWMGYDIRGMDAAWIAWGRAQGYRW
jgi:hypothetical protein